MPGPNIGALATVCVAAAFCAPQKCESERRCIALFTWMSLTRLIDATFPFIRLEERSPAWPPRSSPIGERYYSWPILRGPNDGLSCLNRAGTGQPPGRNKTADKDDERHAHQASK